MKKRKILMLVLVALVSIFALKSNAFALTCPGLDNVEIDESIPDLVSLIIKIIWVAVPILLVVFGSIDLVKGLAAQKEDEIKKGQQTFVKRLIAGVIVFFVIAVVKLIISAVAHDDNIMTCACYFIEGSSSSKCQD